MSTPNFYNDQFFDLFVADDEEVEFITEKDLDLAVQYAEKKFNKCLDFFKVTLCPGHYSGIQLKIEDSDFCREYGTPEDLDNEDCRFQWDICRSKAIRKYESEKRFLNRRFLPEIANFLGMRKLICMGVFSNGEAVYQYA